MRENRFRGVIHFHFIVFIFGFTSIIGALISWEAITIVWYRMLLASFFLFIFIALFKPEFTKIKSKEILSLILGGFLIASHWIAFFKSIKLVGVSPTLAMLSTGAIITAFLEPIFYKRKVLMYEIIFGSIAMIGTLVIFRSAPESFFGMSIALLATTLGVFYTLINGKLTTKYPATIINFYEMIIGFGFTTVYLIFFGVYDKVIFKFSINDLIWILILSSVCTAYAITKSISLMKVLKPYSIMLILNMEPIYAIILALLIFGENEFMNIYFYLGLGLIMIAIVCNSIYKSSRKLSSLS